jgi:hypothetical protein
MTRYVALASPDPNPMVRRSKFSTIATIARPHNTRTEFCRGTGVAASRRTPEVAIRQAHAQPWPYCRLVYTLCPRFQTVQGFICP